MLLEFQPASCDRRFEYTSIDRTELFMVGAKRGQFLLVMQNLLTKFAIVSSIKDSTRAPKPFSFNIGFRLYIKFCSEHRHLKNLVNMLLNGFIFKNLIELLYLVSQDLAIYTHPTRTQP
jgi:hypothetical protein